MAIWNPDNVILTNKGQEVLSKVQAGVGKLTVTRIVTGGAIIPYAQLYLAEEIPEEKQECTILSTVTDRKGSEISVSIDNKELTEEYTLYTIGVYVTHPDFDGEILYLVAECDTAYPDVIPLPSVTVATMFYSVYMEHTDTDQIVIQVNPDGTLTNDVIGKPGGVAGLDADGKLKDEQIPAHILREEDIKEMPQYKYVVDGAPLTDLLAEMGNTPFWGVFTSPQGPVADGKCMYICYPILNENGEATGNVFINATDLTAFSAYTYYGAIASIATDKWNVTGGSSSSNTSSLAFATCATAAATGAKTVTVDGFELNAGASLLVSFTNANTASTVTLDVSGTGAKSIVDSNGANITAISAPLLRGTCLFVYNGSAFVLLKCTANDAVFGFVKLSDTKNSSLGASSGVAATPKAVHDAIINLKAPKWGTCTTAAATAAKVASADDFSLVTGASVLLYVSTANSVASPTLNVNSTGAKAIVDKNGAALTATNAALFGGLCLLAYNGTYWVLLDSMGNASLFGGVKLSDSTSSTSAAAAGVASTPKAVKAAYDLANGKAVKVLYTGTLTTTWSDATTGYTQTLTVNGVLASDTPVIGIVQTTTVATNQTLLENWALVSRITTAANSITAYAYGDKPTVALPIQILCVR